MDKLKPCPFCGAEPYIEYNDEHDEVEIGCSNIECKVCIYVVAKGQEAVEAWNRTEKPKEPHWIPCSERLPEEHEWIGTKTFGTTISDEVYVTFESPKGERFAKHLSFQNGKVSNFVQREIDAFHKDSVPIAWMPLPKPYKGGK